MLPSGLSERSLLIRPLATLVSSRSVGEGEGMSTFLVHPLSKCLRCLHFSVAFTAGKDQAIQDTPNNGWCLSNGGRGKGMFSVAARARWL